MYKIYLKNIDETLEKRKVQGPICEANYFTCEADFTQPKVGFHFFVASATKNKKPRRAV